MDGQIVVRKGPGRQEIATERSTICCWRSAASMIEKVFLFIDLDALNKSIASATRCYDVDSAVLVPPGLAPLASIAEDHLQHQQQQLLLEQKCSSPAASSSTLDTLDAFTDYDMFTHTPFTEVPPFPIVQLRSEVDSEQATPQRGERWQFTKYADNECTIFSDKRRHVKR